MTADGEDREVDKDEDEDGDEDGDGDDNDDNDDDGDNDGGTRRDVCLSPTALNSEAGVQ